MSSDYKGLLLVVSSPSGAGKTTLCRRLREEFPQIRFSVSYTTRPPRPGEVHGREYFFVDRDDFTAMVARDEFAEYALVHGNNYGTSAALVRDALASGTDLLFDIDFQGGRQLRRAFPHDVVLVFILPPSLGELQRRLEARNTDAPEVIERRLRVARDELSHYGEYDYVIVNDDLDRAYAALRAIYIAETQRCARQRGAAEAVLSGQQVLSIARGKEGA
ncbi:guanylate kinase [Nannocystis pusilla]|uniref:Guanylate kinase n=1 Tax=Nannocystis pusilla TaxID=889268 RepID=A0ABS7U2M5_9BACT|nr:guanylate kinase [Nannocystis pusilla]MBZ5714779.1 guanylate kinase [Nannocystis pusilla]